MKMIVSESSVISRSAHRFLLVKSQLVGWPPAGVALPGTELEPDAFDEGFCMESDSRARLWPHASVTSGAGEEFKPKKGVRVVSAREPTGGTA
jgi:hypothetical protein